MDTNHLKENTIYKVIINAEGQYSIWQENVELSPGWRDVGKSGTEKECADYLKKTWKDLRPVSLQKEMGNRWNP